MRDYRTEAEHRSDASREHQRLCVRASQRAKTKLAKKYPKQYAKLLREERRKLGLAASMPARIDGSLRVGDDG